jgi:serine/threonine-protein kinase
VPLTVRIDPSGQPIAAPAPDGSTQPFVAASGDTTTQPLPRTPRARRCPSCAQIFSGDARFCPFDGDPLVAAPDYSPTADPLIGQVLEGRYRVESVLGEGGMGTVYEVRHTTLDRRFALKALRRDIARDAELTARFMQEARAAAAIGHPNIVAVSDFGEIGAGKLSATQSRPVPYFVMEYLHGRSLARRLADQGTMNAQEVGVIVAQAASGLAAAHAAGVIHRDLKPDNVFLAIVGDREYVKLLDFGVAKIAGAGRLTRQGIVYGTPHYMSPEQAAGNAIDHRTDVYALGVIMYECFSGRVPFEADTYMGVLTKHMFAKPEPIERVVTDPGCLGALGPIVMRCLEKRPEDRFATMADVAEAIEGALEPGTLARPSRVPGRERLRLRDPAEPRSLSEALSKAWSGAPSERPSARPSSTSIPGMPRSSRGWRVGLGAALVLGIVVVAWRFVGSGAEHDSAGAAAAPQAPAAAVATVAPVPAATAAAEAEARPAEAVAPASSAGAPAAPVSAAPRPAPTGERPAAPKKAPASKPPAARTSGDVVDPW